MEPAKERTFIIKKETLIIQNENKFKDEYKK